MKFYHRGDAVAVKSTQRLRGGGEINAKVVQNLGKFTNSPCLSAFLTLFFVKSVKKTVKDHCSLSCARCLLPADGAKSIYIKRAEQKTLQTLHRTLHSLRISLIIRALHRVGFEAKILHKPCTEPYMGTKSQRDKESKRQRVKETKSQREEERKRGRDKERKSGREEGKEKFEEGKEKLGEG